MCGISVIFSSDPNVNELHVVRMMNAQQHRGPDACNAIKLSMPNNNRLFLAHNRLRITDSSPAADQPFISSCKRYALVFNGQIYNHLALRNRLRVFDIDWKTGSDTETLLNLLIWIGIRVIEDLEGMFAFAFANTQTGKLILARDRFGIKPLYFFANNSVFLASSEARAIIRSGAYLPELETGQVSDYLNYKYAQRPYTLLKNVFELEPGHVLTLDSPAHEPDMQLFVKQKSGNIKYPENNSFDCLITESLLSQWPTDVSAGLMLSGGADSVLLLALLTQAGHNPDAFIAASKHSVSDPNTDLFFAQKAIQQFGGKLHIVQTDQDLPDQMNVWLDNLDLPVADGAAFLTQLIAKNASELGFKVLLSGAGADELFGGYRRHFAFWQYLKHFSGMPWEFIRKHSQIVPEHKQIKTRFKDLSRAISGFSDNPYQTFIALTSQSELSSKLFKPGFVPSNLSYYAPGHPANPEFYMDWALEYDKNQYLCADILAITDKSSMQSSIETRLPYLNNSLNIWARTQAIDGSMEKGQKHHIREALYQKNGKMYAQRRKQGFGSGLMQWLRTPKYRFWFDVFFDTTNSAYQVLEPKYVQQLVNEFLEGKNALDNQILALLLLFHWIKNNNL